MPKAKVRNLYDMVPAKRRSFTTLGDGTVEILLPRYGDGRVGRVIASVFSNKPVRVHLDDIGTAVWNLCDGRRSVREIGESLEREFGERIDPIYDRLEQFLEHMRTKGMIEWRP